MKTIAQTIADHAFFQGMNPEQLKVLAEEARELSFEGGDFMFREGEPANQFYLVESGQIQLESYEPNDGTHMLQSLGPGEVLGWSWLFPPFQWHYRARVMEPTRVIALNGAHLLVVAEKDHQFGYELMKRVAQIVIQRLQTTRRQLREMQWESAWDR